MLVVFLVHLSMENPCSVYHCFGALAGHISLELSSRVGNSISLFRLKPGGICGANIVLAFGFFSRYACMLHL